MVRFIVEALLYWGTKMLLLTNKKNVLKSISQYIPLHFILKAHYGDGSMYLRRWVRSECCLALTQMVYSRETWKLTSRSDSSAEKCSLFTTWQIHYCVSSAQKVQVPLACEGNRTWQSSNTHPWLIKRLSPTLFNQAHGTEALFFCYLTSKTQFGQARLALSSA